jgi:protein-disulfide isomerase
MPRTLPNGAGRVNGSCRFGDPAAPGPLTPRARLDRARPEPRGRLLRGAPPAVRRLDSGVLLSDGWRMMVRDRIVLLLCAVVAGATACATRQSVDSLRTRVANLEHRDARMDGAEQRLVRLEAQNGHILQLVEALRHRLDTLDGKLEALAVQQARPSERPPTRPHAPDPAAVYAVPVADSPVEGPADARITIIKVFDFACPFCERTRATLDEVRRHYGKDVRIVYKHYIVHAQIATIPAQAACAAHMQGKFTAMKDAIWERGFLAPGRDLGQENMFRLARSIGLDMRRFGADLRGPCVARVQQDHQTLGRFGVSATPTFFINGRPLRGAQPFENFRALIDEELAKTNEILRTQGIKPGEYYDRQVLATGRKEL